MYTTMLRQTRGGGGGGAARAQRFGLLLRNYKKSGGINSNHQHAICSTFTSSSRSLLSSPVGVIVLDPSRSKQRLTSSDHVGRLSSVSINSITALNNVRYFTTDNRGGGGKAGRDEKSDISNSHGHRSNFDRDVLQRAARGELDNKNKHTSGIPRLAARKHKANLRPPAAGDRAGRLVDKSRAQDRQAAHLTPLDDEGNEDDDDDEDAAFEDELDDELISLNQSLRLSSSSGGARGSAVGLAGSRGGGRPPQQQQQQQSLDDLFEDDDYHAFELIDDDKYYWREEEQEKLVNASDEFDESLLYDEDGNFVVEYTEEDDLQFKPLLDQSDRRSRLSDERVGFLRQADEKPDVDNRDGGDYDGDGDDNRENAADEWTLKKLGPDPEERFFYDNNDIFEICQRDDGDVYDPMTPEEEEFYNTTMPLAPHEPGLDGFLQAMHEHPTKYATVTFENLHPGSKREPKPIFFPKIRKQPPVEWVQSHKRFLYVTGLPPLTVNGERGNMSKAVHRSLLQQSIAKLVVGVDDYSTQVCVANRSSAYVGFASPRQLASALAAGPQEPYLKKVPMISQYQPSASSAATDKEVEFITMRPDCIVRFTNIPPGNTSASVARNLFPPGTKVGEVYGAGLTADDVFFMTETRILVRFASPEQTQSAVTSALVLKRLEEWGTYPVQFLRARRELVHAGFGVISKDEEVRVMGPRLIVDGDMPSRQFHISHAGTILLRNLDVTDDFLSSSSSSWQSSLKDDLTEVFQPFCERLRDGNRSIEFVTCQAGRFTGRAYIGFDEPGEAEACINQCKGRLKLGDRILVLKLVHDRIVPHQAAFKPEKRPARPEHELLDDLNNWEKYVDAADIEYLQKHGVSKLVIDEVLRGIRRSNPTFGAFDAGLRSEALEPSMERGQQYKELVQMYVATLKDCIATPDDVGAMYEALHFPDEPIDLSVFDKWKERLKDIERVRSGALSS